MFALKTIVLIIAALAIIFVWGIFITWAIPGDETGPYLTRTVLSIIVGFTIGRLGFSAWDVWTEDDRW